MLEVLLGVLSVMGTLLGGGLGIVGILTNTHMDVPAKNRAGQPTTRKVLNRWGKIALVLALSGLLVAISTEVIQKVLGLEEHREAAAKSVAAAKRTQHVVEQLRRSVSRFERITYSVEIGLPMDDPDVQAYVERLKTDFERLKSQLEPGGQVEGIRVMSYAPGLVAISYNKASTLFPDEIHEPKLYEYASHVVAWLRFHKSEPPEFRAYSGFPLNKADLHLQPLNPERTLSYDHLDGTLSLLLEVEWNARSTHGSGRIVSTHDLEGVFLTLQFGRGGVDQAIRDKSKPIFMWLKCDNQEFRLPGTLFARKTSLEGVPYHAAFLNDLDQFVLFTFGSSPIHEAPATGPVNKN